MSTVNSEAQNPPARPAGQKAGWTISGWAAEANLCRMTTYNLLDGKVRNAPRLPSVKIGKRRLITISPIDYLASLPRVS
jgi:hypothetical protein